MPALMTDNPTIWMLAAIAAFCIGVSKAGFSGISLISVFILADVFGAKESLGFALPMLIMADLMVYPAFRKYASWKSVWLLTWPALVGMGIGVLVLGNVDNAAMRKIIGSIILVMVSLQLLGRFNAEGFYKIALTRKFGFFFGTTGGVATVLANAAGPIMQIYMLSRRMDKMELIGVGARFFLVINFLKLPLGAGMNLITASSLLSNLLLLPAIALGVFGGKKVLVKIPQRAFEATVIVFAMIAGVKLCFF
ncbi:sulfite exporter TauE/SafE family protein [Verrucomicrobiaceae bacterium 5K15]|uniref:Probable membrane transporter protein n=1 Tax=Oceaniferula flava TaxID=2800421 RepID=A0AAE2SE13_9BACT|nr:sulfite exporter TauE/SafE family protein [Oceaniferula flavus]MBK1856024.1 sulfite exporter TauE/SafE family protein [Oceaniferula flavus]MBM1137331.1 sulfite exporter TauE/SafE family protein [Oceaniferula flavus]